MNPLQQLKDIHSPAPIPFWPLAPGWYILIGIFLVLCLLGVYLLYEYRNKHLAKKLALKRLQHLRNKALQQPDKKIITELSVLVRRAALIKYSRHEIAGLQGNAWLKFLDKSADTNAFTSGAGRALTTAPYEKNPEPNYTELFDLIEMWMEKNLRGR